MAKRVSKHTLRHIKDIADEKLRRLAGSIVDRLNEFTSVFADADGSTERYLRADMTWVNPHSRTLTRIVGPAAWQPTTEANWTTMNGTGDYWTCSGGAGTRITCSLPVVEGERVVGAGVTFYRGTATDPTVRVLAATLGASATVLTPTVAWTSPSASTTWEQLTATYNQDVNSNHFALEVLAQNGDRVRAGYVTVELVD